MKIKASVTREMYVRKRVEATKLGEEGREISHSGLEGREELVFRLSELGSHWGVFTREQLDLVNSQSFGCQLSDRVLGQGEARKTTWEAMAVAQESGEWVMARGSVMVLKMGTGGQEQWQGVTRRKEAPCPAGRSRVGPRLG